MLIPIASYFNIHNTRGVRISTPSPSDTHQLHFSSRLNQGNLVKSGMVKKIVSSVFLVFIFLQLAITNPAQVFATNWCCPSHFSRCGNTNDPDKFFVCKFLKLDENECVKVEGSIGERIKIDSNTFLVHAYDCDAQTAKIDCEWTTLNNSESQYNGKPTFCLGGFANPDDVKAVKADFFCSDNCGNQGDQLATLIKSGGKTTLNKQSVNVGALGSDYQGIGFDENNKFFTCLSGDFDSSIKNTVEACVKKRAITYGASIVAVAVAFHTGPFSIITVPVTLAGGGAAVAYSYFTDCEPEITASVSLNGLSCSGKFHVKLDLTTDIDGATIKSEPNKLFNLCDQIPNSDGKNQALYDSCINCYKEKNGVWTAVGCIKSDSKSILNAAISIGLSLSGGVVFLLIVISGAIFSLSKGDSKRTNDAREMLTNAIIGLFFIVFSITILRFLGVTILQIPGFGSGGG